MFESDWAVASIAAARRDPSECQFTLLILQLGVPLDAQSPLLDELANCRRPASTILHASTCFGPGERHTCRCPSCCGAWHEVALVSHFSLARHPLSGFHLFHVPNRLQRAGTLGDICICACHRFKRGSTSRCARTSAGPQMLELELLTPRKCVWPV